MKFTLRRILFLFLFVIVGSSCQYYSFNWQEALFRIEGVLVDLSAALEGEMLLESDEVLEDKSIPNFKNLSLASWNIQHLGRSKTDEEIWEMDKYCVTLTL